MKIAPPVSDSSAWCVPSKPLIFDSDQVHVWRATLDLSPSQIDSFWHTLSSDEKARAERFYFHRDRDRFVAARGVLRAILGLYLEKAPEGLSFCYGSHGKPALVQESDNAIRFYISHSDGVALYAVTRGREVGIDLELIRRGLEIEEIAERFFSPLEIAALRALPTPLRTDAFFLCWTRKEAYIKARGEGLSLPLDQFDVSLIPGESATLMSTRPDSDEAFRWSLQDLTMDPGYAAALAVEGHGQSYAYWQWSASPRKA